MPCVSTIFCVSILALQDLRTLGPTAPATIHTHDMTITRTRSTLNDQIFVFPASNS